MSPNVQAEAQGDAENNSGMRRVTTKKGEKIVYLMGDLENPKKEAFFDDGTGQPEEWYGYYNTRNGMARQTNAPE